jgi:mannitol/fructose-specific phosphotransferase system IIA component (Ntr-type)
MSKSILSSLVIETGVEAKNWEESIRKAGELLLNIGGIESRYIDKMIENVIELGPYIVIAKGIALAHARPENGVNFACMSLITLKEPVNFGNEVNDPVKLIVVIATRNNEEHINSLKKLAEILSDETKFNNIVNSKDKNEIADILIK